MKFNKTTCGYTATRKDGQVIRIERSAEAPSSPEYTWWCRYENDFYGDNTHCAKTKKELVLHENYVEDNI